MRKIIKTILLFCLVIIYSGASPDKTPEYQMSATLYSPSYTFATLPAQANGKVLYCSDCANTIPCSGGGTGSIAIGLNNQFTCQFGNTSAPGLATLVGYTGGVGIIGNSGNGNDKIDKVSVNGIDNVVAFGADSTGTNDSWSALMSTVADACTNNKAVLFPPGTYKVLTPFAPVCSTHPLLLYSDSGTIAEVSGSPAVTIKEGFSGDSGPTVILDHYQEISNLNSGNILTSPAVGSVGKSLSFTNAGTQVVYAVDLNDVMAHPSLKLNGLPAFDYRGWYNLASLTTGGGSFGNFLVGSVGGVDGNNTYEACNINTGSGYEGDGLSNLCEGQFAIQTGTDGKIFARFYTTGNIYRINSGTTTWGTGTWHFVELSYDGTNLRLIVDGTLRGVTGATGTTIQRSDESLLIGQELPRFIHLSSGAIPLLNGQVFSPEISNVARSTCGGSVTLGTSCYGNPSAANPGDSNSLFLWNGDLTNLPLNNGIAVPILEPDRVNGVAMNTTTTTAWLHVRDIGGGNPIGCCSNVITMRGFNIQGGTHGIDDNGEQVILSHILTSSSNFSGAGDIGIELSQNATFNSHLQHIFAANGGSLAGYLPLAFLGGLSEGDDLNMGCAGLCMEEQGGNFSDIFTQLSSLNKWTLVHWGGNTTFLFANFDSENGANNIPLSYWGGVLTLINSSLTPGTGNANYRIEGSPQWVQINQIGGQLAPSGTTIIDASTISGNEAQEYNFYGVNFGNDFPGNIPNGVQWITPASFMQAIHVDTASEQTAGVRNQQQYSLLTGLHVDGPVVGGLLSTGAYKGSQFGTVPVPVVTVKGTTGAASYSYFCVPHDFAGGTKPASAVTTITNGNASLSTTNFNQIQCGPLAGANNWDVLKTNTSTSLALAQSGYQVIVNDTGQGTSAYTNPTRDSTGDFTLPANAITNLTEGTCPVGTSGIDLLCANSTTHQIESSYNNGTRLRVPQIIATGTSALGTVSVTNATCATTVTTAATGVLSTDSIIWSHNAAVTSGTNGSLVIHSFPTANNVNFQECNPTAGAITPPADTLNWTVVR